MILNQDLHDTTQIEFGEIMELKTPEGRVFYARGVIFHTKDGRVRIDAMSDDKKSLEVVL